MLLLPVNTRRLWCNRKMTYARSKLDLVSPLVASNQVPAPLVAILAHIFSKLIWDSVRLASVKRGSGRLRAAI